MHICFVAIDFHQAGQGGGIASYTYTLGQELIRRGHQVTIIAKGNSLEWRDVDGLQVLVWPFGNISWYLYRLRLLNDWLILPIREWEWSWSIRRALQAVNKRCRIDLIESGESGSQFIGHLGSAHLIRTHGAPYLFSKHTGEKLTPGLRLSHRFELRALRRAKLVTAPSRMQARELGAELGWRADRIKAIPNPAPEWALEWARAPQKTISPDRPMVLYTGRIQSVKGSLILLESVTSVAQAFPQVRYVIAGGRHLSISEETWTRALDQDNRRAHVTLLGHVPWRELAAWYQQATLFVMPSYYETFCISCVEAMAFGLPIVATTAGGLPEVVQDGVTGILVPPGDSQALSDAIVELLRNPERCQRMGQAGRERALAEFSPARVADQTLAVYQQCLALP